MPIFIRRCGAETKCLTPETGILEYHHDAILRTDMVVQSKDFLSTCDRENGIFDSKKNCDQRKK